MIICIKPNYKHDFQSLSCSCVISYVKPCTLTLPTSQCPWSFDSTCLQESYSGFQSKGEGVERIESIAEVKTFSTRVITTLLNEDKYQVKQGRMKDGKGEITAVKEKVTYITFK